jgi:hypothetical protein
MFRPSETEFLLPHLTYKNIIAFGASCLGAIRFQEKFI